MKPVLDTVFRSGSYARVLDFLITENENTPHFDYSKLEIVAGAGVDTATAERILPNLVDLGIIIMTRKIGQRAMYRINSANPAIKSLADFTAVFHIQYDKLTQGGKKEIARHH